MSFRLWLRGDDDAGCLDLGPIVPALKAMQEWARAVPEVELDDEEKWGALFWLVHADDQDLPAEYVDALLPQVARMLDEHGGELGEASRSVLESIAKALTEGGEAHFGGHDYATVQVDLPPQLAAAVVEFGAALPEPDLGDDGLEGRPHVTVRYGLETSSVDAVKAALAGCTPAAVTLGPLGLFHQDGQDVLFVEASGGGLSSLRAALAAVPNVQTRAEYVPHVTVAYVRPGAADHLEGAAVPGVTGQAFVADWAAFVTADGMETSIYLTGGA